MFFFNRYRDHRALHSFPTRRSSDLMGISASRLPVVGNGAHLGAPELLKVAGADVMENMLVTVANWSNEGQRELIERSEEHTSELQSPYDLVCRLLLEKKKQKRSR